MNIIKNNVYFKLMKVQNKLRAPKGQYNQFGHYSYRSCEDILEALKPLLAEVEAIVNVSDEVKLIGNRFYVEATATFLDCETGDSIVARAYAREDETKKGMDLAQVTGSVSSYARKYALNGLFAIDDNKDADTSEYKKQQENDNRKSTTKKVDKPVEMIEEGQITAIRILLKDHEELKNAVYKKFEITSSKEMPNKLTKSQATSLIKQLKQKVGE